MFALVASRSGFATRCCPGVLPGRRRRRRFVPARRRVFVGSWAGVPWTPPSPSGSLVLQTALRQTALLVTSSPPGCVHWRNVFVFHIGCVLSVWWIVVRIRCDWVCASSSCALCWLWLRLRVGVCRLSGLRVVRVRSCSCSCFSCVSAMNVHVFSSFWRLACCVSVSGCFVCGCGVWCGATRLSLAVVLALLPSCGMTLSARCSHLGLGVSCGGCARRASVPSLLAFMLPCG